MSLPSIGLDAFYAVATLKSFSAAADKLFITQSALSQRVLNLEQLLGSTLIIRDTKGLRLTDTGHQLFHFCRSKELLEEEFTSGLELQNSTVPVGKIRIGGFSTICKSCLLPIVAELLKKYPHLKIELKSFEMRELESALTTGAVDYILTNEPVKKQGLHSQKVGYEENILVQSLSESLKDTYLDHDPEDQTTFDYFAYQGQKLKNPKRIFLDEVYQIIEGVRLGIGKAVLPKHLLHKEKGLKVASGFKPQKIPVYLCYFEMPYYTKLQSLFAETVIEKMPQYLLNE